MSDRVSKPESSAAEEPRQRQLSFAEGVAQATPHTALEAMQAAEIETVYKTAPIGLALFDPVEFRYLRLNDRQAEFFGFPPEYLLGKTVTEMAPIPGVRELFEQVAAGEPVINYPLEGELVGRPGEYRYWVVNYFPVWGADGKVQAITAASLEITQQRKAEMALIQNERVATLGRLATSISHEINNPLEAVTNLLYLVSEARELSRENREFLDMAQRELARVSQIVVQSLRFQRQSEQRAAMDMASAIDGVLDLYKAKLAGASVTVVREYRARNKVFALENEIRQVLSNLIGNSIDAMQSGGIMRIRIADVTQPSGIQGMRISIGDSGHGMSRETRARVFEPFFTTKAMEGNGLGLWISTDIVKRHGGRLCAWSSQRPGKHGTVMSLFLPES